MSTSMRAAEACLDAAGTLVPVAAFVGVVVLFFLVLPWFIHFMDAYMGFCQDFMDRKSRERAARRAAKELQRQETRENP